MQQKRMSDAIFSIAWGYVLIHLHFRLGPVDLLPDWLGYILFYSAINMIKEKEPSAKSLQPLTIVLGIWDVALIFFQEIQAFGIIITVLSLYFHYQFLTNIANIAGKYMCLEQDKILKLRIVRTILVTVFAVPIPWNDMAIFTYALIVANMVVAIWLCATLFSLKKSVQIREDSIEIE